MRPRSASSLLKLGERKNESLERVVLRHTSMDVPRPGAKAPGAQYVDFQSFDNDYHESWDIESGMHPHTLAVYAQDGPLSERRVGRADAHLLPVKLGYKDTKYWTHIVFMPARNGGNWSHRGYEGCGAI